MSNDKINQFHSNPADLERMIKCIGPDIGRALDVATGGGYTALKLAEHAEEVVSVDISNNRLNQAQELAVNRGIDSINFIPMDVHKLEFADSTFDVAVCRFGLHHFADLHTALTEMVRVLKTGGKLYLFDSSVINGHITESMINHIETLRDPSHKGSYSQRQWEQLLKELPLEIEIIELHRDEYQLPQWYDRCGTPQESRDEITCYLDSLTPTLKRYYLHSHLFMSTYKIEIAARKI